MHRRAWHVRDCTCDGSNISLFGHCTCTVEPGTRATALVMIYQTITESLHMHCLAWHARDCTCNDFNIAILYHCTCTAEPGMSMTALFMIHHTITGSLHMHRWAWHVCDCTCDDSPYHYWVTAHALLNLACVCDCTLYMMKCSCSLWGRSQLHLSADMPEPREARGLPPLLVPKLGPRLRGVRCLLIVSIALKNRPTSLSNSYICKRECPFFFTWDNTSFIRTDTLSSHRRVALGLL